MRCWPIPNDLLVSAERWSRPFCDADSMHKAYLNAYLHATICVLHWQAAAH